PTSRNASSNRRAQSAMESPASLFADRVYQRGLTSPRSAVPEVAREDLHGPVPLLRREERHEHLEEGEAPLDACGGLLPRGQVGCREARAGEPSRRLLAVVAALLEVVALGILEGRHPLVERGAQVLALLRREAELLGEAPPL